MLGFQTGSSGGRVRCVLAPQHVDNTPSGGSTRRANSAEGWAFDPARTEEATRAIFPGEGAEIRTFHEVELVAVRAAQDRRAP